MKKINVYCSICGKQQDSFNTPYLQYDMKDEQLQTIIACNNTGCNSTTFTMKKKIDTNTSKAFSIRVRRDDSVKDVYDKISGLLIKVHEYAAYFINKEPETWIKLALGNDK